MPIVPKGLTVNVLAGMGVPRPLPEPLLSNFESIEVSETTKDRSGFSMKLVTGRSRPQDVLDYPGLMSGQLRANSRVIITVAFGPFPSVLFDGFIQQMHLGVGSEAGQAKIDVKGKDYTSRLERDETPQEYPCMSDAQVASFILLTHGLVPLVIPPPTSRPPLPIERTPASTGTPLAHLQHLAERNGYVFYVIPGPLPGANTGYWGPPVRAGVQHALTIHMGEATNVKDFSFTQDSEASTFYEGLVDDPDLCVKVPVTTVASLRPPLAAVPLWLTPPPLRRKRRLRAHGAGVVDTFAHAQAKLDESTDAAVEVRGTLDAGRYGHILRARGLVGLRGAGYTHDGFYYVKEVTHTITRAGYEQAFVLTREGTGSTSPVVPP